MQIALASEAVTREQADSELQARFAAEAQAREQADHELQDVLIEMGNSLAKRLTADELSYTRQTSELTRVFQQQTLHSRNEVARLEEKITANQLSASKQSAELAKGSLQQGKRLDLLAETVTVNQLSTSQQIANVAETSLEQGQRLTAISDNMAVFMSYVNERLAQLSLASILQSRRIGIKLPLKPRPVDTWTDDDDGEIHPFSQMTFSSDEDGTVLLGDGLNFVPVP